MNYYEHVSKATSWEVLELPPVIEVSERKLTNEEAEAFRQWMTKHNDSHGALDSASSLA